jgi:uncharacterized protein with PQ loop repeat
MAGWPASPDRQTVSDLFGTASFAIWLFAQSPQLYENYRRGSVDGLSPVFLTQWMLGDATNLIGCILTQQLPFQIAVATYFCCIDVCIMIQFTYYWNKARKARKQRKTRTQRTNSLTAYAHNPYSVLAETSELLPGRSSRQHSLLRSSSKRRNLSHSQVLHQQRHAHASHDHADKISATEARASRPHAASRSRSRHVDPMSRSASTDTVPGTAAVANYRALSNAAMSVAQLAQEAARRREAMLHRVQADGDDYFSYSRPGSLRSHRSKSRASESPNTSLPPSRSRSRVNSNELGPDSVRAELSAAVPSSSSTAADATSGATGRRARVARSMSARRKAVPGAGDFVPSALSPTREGRDADERTDDDTESEEVSGTETAPAMADSVDSLATVSSEASGGSGPAEPRGRDMVRMASRLETVTSSGAATPVAAVQRDGTGSPFSAGSSEGTARHASPKPLDRLAMSHHQLGQQSDADSSDDDHTGRAKKDGARKRSKRDPAEASDAMYRSVDTLMAANGRRKGALVRSESSRSHHLASTSTARGGSRKSGTKSPASMRRSIGMVLLGIMMISSLPPSSTAAAINPALAGALRIEDGAAWNRLVGRISAWLCALLYITSRIPQIWENHMRRSVAGLSILLFIAAFSGNLLYSVSVLTNPAAASPGARAYLQESLPFLLGSGGTLIFDLIIVGQWLAWRHKPPML